jgi:hypothetical protein
MKRSDMVKVIEKAMRCWNGAYYNQSLESHILEYIEKAGMAPPFTEVEQNNNGDKIIMQSRTWDSENQ